MSDLGQRLRQAREAAGLSLSGMASRTGYSNRYLGNIETGVRRVTPRIIRSYEQVLDLDRRSLLAGVLSAVVTDATTGPDLAVDIFRDISAERSALLATVQTSHGTDKAIGALVSANAPCVASLIEWARKGPPILRVNSIGILAKVRSSMLDNGVVQALKADEDARELYLTAVCSRVLRMPWDDAIGLLKRSRPLTEQAQLQAFAAELGNPYDSGARWASLIVLARMRPDSPTEVDLALHERLKLEPSRELVRTVGAVLAGLDPLTI